MPENITRRIRLPFPPVPRLRDGLVKNLPWWPRFVEVVAGAALASAVELAPLGGCRVNDVVWAGLDDDDLRSGAKNLDLMFDWDEVRTRCRIALGPIHRALEDKLGYDYTIAVKVLRQEELFPEDA